jgi:hypothetical protein
MPGQPASDTMPASDPAASGASQPSMSAARGLRAKSARRVADLDDCQFADRPWMTDFLQERARALCLLGEEVVEPARDGDDLRGQDRVERAGGQRARQQVERAAHRAAPSTGTPAATSIDVSRISGKPMSAVGSSDSTRSTRAMPSDSIFAAPAQS